MSYAEEIRRQAEAAPRAALPAVTAALWARFNEGRITEPEAEALSAMIEARKVSADIGLPAPDRAGRPRTGVGSRPRTCASLERRRCWAASGRLPPALAARFTLAEQAVLAMVAAETAKRGDCRLAVGHLAAITGVSETTVRNAIREARLLGLLTVEERQITGFRNDTNIVRIVSPEWLGWLRLARRGDPLKSQPIRHPSLAGRVRGANPRRARLLRFQDQGERGEPHRRGALRQVRVRPHGERRELQTHEPGPSLWTAPRRAHAYGR